MDVWAQGYRAGERRGWSRGFAAGVIVTIALMSLAALLACRPPPPRPAPPWPRYAQDLEVLEQQVVAAVALRDDDVAAFRRAVLLGGAVVCGAPYRDQVAQAVRRPGCTFLALRDPKAARLETSAGPSGPRRSP